MAKKRTVKKRRHLSGPREDCFHRLADEQRGRPESAMMKIHKDTLSPMYGSVAEHVGDLTHRMSQFPEHPQFQHGFPYVGEKVSKTLRWLTQAYGFEREVHDNVRAAIKYHAERGAALPCGDFSGCLSELKRRGAAYANEHRKLKPCNAVQRVARDAAVAVGEFRFKDAVDRLRSLKYLVDQGSGVWFKEAGKHRT